jgi:hypothetical protein
MGEGHSIAISALGHNAPDAKTLVATRCHTITYNATFPSAKIALGLVLAHSAEEFPRGARQRLLFTVASGADARSLGFVVIFYGSLV